MMTVQVALGSDIDPGIWYVERMCSITLIEPFYNCGKMWIYAYFADSELITEPVNHSTLFGYAFHDDFDWDLYRDDVGICNFFPQISTINATACTDSWFAMGNRTMDTCWDDKCKSMFQHELDHMVCECNWHENMTRPEEIRM